VDRWDLLEFAGIALLVVFAALVWWPAAFAVAGISLIVESQLRSLQPPVEPEPEDGTE